jgi:hypothetical protein
MIYPSADDAGSAEAIMGPDPAGKGKDWLIKSRDLEPTGTVYQIKFEWADHRKKISWEPVSKESAGEAEVLGTGYRHSYYVIGSWNHWGLEEMAFNASEGWYETSFRAAESGMAEFRFLRNRDFKQQIYPAEAKAENATIPIRGPSGGPGNRAFCIKARSGEIIKLGVRILDGHISVSASWNESDKVWKSDRIRDILARPYGITGSLNGWTISPMKPDPDNAGVFTFRFECEYDLPESFQITVDGDTACTLHPNVRGAGLMEGMLEGPDEDGADLAWTFDGVAGQCIEISLDFTQDDRRRMVYWRRVAQSAAAMDAIGRT